MKAKINDVVMSNTDIEISPLHVVKAKTFGKVLDTTVPNYVYVKFADGKNGWLDEKYITVVK